MDIIDYFRPAGAAALLATSISFFISPTLIISSPAARYALSEKWTSKITLALWAIFYSLASALIAFIPLAGISSTFEHLWMQIAFAGMSTLIILGVCAEISMEARRVANALYTRSDLHRWIAGHNSEDRIARIVSLTVTATRVSYAPFIVALPGVKIAILLIFTFLENPDDASADSAVPAAVALGILAVIVLASEKIRSVIALINPSALLIERCVSLMTGLSPYKQSKRNPHVLPNNAVSRWRTEQQQSCVSISKYLIRSLNGLRKKSQGTGLP